MALKVMLLNDEKKKKTLNFRRGSSDVLGYRIWTKLTHNMKRLRCNMNLETKRRTLSFLAG